VALVGQSGSGKSSIISLVERFYDPDGGLVTYNGKDLRDTDTKWYHQEKIAIVQQEPCLFTTTIRENILYGYDTSGMTDEELKERLKTVLEQASCGFLLDKSRFPDGINTKVGERGQTLSGGQK